MKILSRIRDFTKAMRDFYRLPGCVSDLRDLILFSETKRLQEQHPNPLNRFGRKCFSQGDEDGITLEILARANRLEGGVFVELGVGDGLENNTLILAALGWRGCWIGGEELQLNLLPTNDTRLVYHREWLTRENVVALVQGILEQGQLMSPDVISLDLDGNDIYLIEELLTNGFRPTLYIVEYNAKFPPPILFKIAYDADHRWGGDDYFGASLASYVNLFVKFGYRLVCCNSQTGANAFFVDVSLDSAFSDVPTSLSELYCEPRYKLYGQYGQKQSRRTVQRILTA